MQDQETYSPFWICLVVFIAILATGISQTAALIEQRTVVKSAEKNVKQTNEKYKAAQAKIESIAKDLKTLAATNENARKIVQEFNIRVNTPLSDSTGNTRPSSPASPPKPATAPSNTKR